MGDAGEEADSQEPAVGRHLLDTLTHNSLSTSLTVFSLHNYTPYNTVVRFRYVHSVRSLLSVVGRAAH